MVEVVKYAATGRRKSSVARVNLTPGSGEIRVNKRPFDEYFKRETFKVNEYPREIQRGRPCGRRWIDWPGRRFPPRVIPGVIFVRT